MTGRAEGMVQLLRRTNLQREYLTEQQGKALERVFRGVAGGIELCIAGKCIHSALILSYSAIDNMAFLYMPSKQQDVTSKDFKNWATVYIKPPKTLGCSAEELWSARCGLLHSLTSESRLTRSKGVRHVCYSWGNKQPLPSNSSKDWVMIKVEELRDQLLKGIQRFFADVDKDQELQQRALQRLKKLLVDLEDLMDRGTIDLPT